MTAQQAKQYRVLRAKRLIAQLDEQLPADAIGSMRELGLLARMIGGRTIEKAWRCWDLVSEIRENNRK